MSAHTPDADPKEDGEWDSVSTVYHSTVGRLTFPIAIELVSWVNSVSPLNQPNVKTLDSGCGTGVVCSVIKELYPSSPLLAIDSSPGMVSTVQTTAKESGWTDFEARVQDVRELSIESKSLTHVFSTFVICLAPDPDRIAGEMHRVLQPEGVLGLAVWGDPNFEFFQGPWNEACRELDPAYEAPGLMDPEWTYAANVEKGLVKAGFRDVEVRSKQQSWYWHNVQGLLKYIFKGDNPALQKWITSWTERGWSIEKVKPVYERKLEEAYGQRDGALEGPVSVCLAIARR